MLLFMMMFVVDSPIFYSQEKLYREHDDTSHKKRQDKTGYLIRKSVVAYEYICRYVKEKVVQHINATCAILPDIHFMLVALFEVATSKTRLNL